MTRKIRERIGGPFILLGLLGMCTIEPGETLWPYIIAITLCLAAVIGGTRMGGWML